MSAHLSQAQNPGYVHVSVRNAARRAEIARRMKSGAPAAAGSVSSASSSSQANGHPSTAPVPVLAQNGGGPQLVQPDVVARGFVVYVGLDEDTATAAGTSLHKIATELRDYVESIAPESQVHIAMAMASALTEGSDLDVVRQALGDPTVTHRTMEAPVTTPPAPSNSGVLIDLSRREVKLDGENLNLTYKEFELLNYLVENGARTVGRDELLKTLWRNIDEDQMPNERTIDVHIRRLRSKLGRLANTVRTVRGQGYRFYEHPEVTVWAAPEYSI